MKKVLAMLITSVFTSLLTEYEHIKYVWYLHD